MAHQFIKAACATAGLVLALAAAGTAHAAKPLSGSPAATKQSLSIKQKNDLARAMARPGAAKAAPSKAARANKSATTVAPGGDETSIVPEELYNYLGATPDASGRMHVRDINPNAQPAAAVEPTNEK